MTDNLSPAAIEQLRILDTKGATQIPDTPDMQPLWEHRYVMGDRNKAHITVSGHTLVRKHHAQ